MLRWSCLFLLAASGACHVGRGALQARGGSSPGGGHEKLAAQDGHQQEVRSGGSEKPRTGAGGYEPGDYGADAHAVAVGLLSTVVLVPLVVSMALTEGPIHELTMKMLDTFISIFLAVMWFNTFLQFFETFEINDLFPYAREVLSLLQVVILYLIATGIAWLWRDETMRLTTFCSCGAHFIAFAGITAGATNQAAVSKHLPDGQDEPAVFAFVLIAGGFLAGLFIVNRLVWQRTKDFEKINHAIDDMEMDVLGMVLSFLITQAVRNGITGKYPEAHLLLAQEDWAPHRYRHTMVERWFMFFWSVGLTVLAAYMIPLMEDFATDKSEAVWKGIRVVKVMMVMLIAWGFLLWGQWEFYEYLFRGEEMFGCLVFALGATFVCMAALCTVATWGDRAERMSRQVRETNAITTAGISLVAAWSWEHCFNLSFDIIGHSYAKFHKGLVPKMLLSIIIPAALLPTYVRHVRSRVVALEARHGHGRHHHHRVPGEETTRSRSPSVTSQLEPQPFEGRSP